MKYSELTTKSEGELFKDLANLRGKADELRQKNKLGQVKNHRELMSVRKDIARILTFLRAKI